MAPATKIDTRKSFIATSLSEREFHANPPHARSNDTRCLQIRRPRQITGAGCGARIEEIENLEIQLCSHALTDFEILRSLEIRDPDYRAAMSSKGFHPESCRALQKQWAREAFRALTRDSRLRAIESRQFESPWQVIDRRPAGLPIPRVVNGERIGVRTGPDRLDPLVIP